MWNHEPTPCPQPNFPLLTFWGQHPAFQIDLEGPAVPLDLAPSSPATYLHSLARLEDLSRLLTFCLGQAFFGSLDQGIFDVTDMKAIACQSSLRFQDRSGRFDLRLLRFNRLIDKLFYRTCKELSVILFQNEMDWNQRVFDEINVVIRM